MPRPFTRLPEPLAFIRHFTPNWFTMTMGTGVVALVVAQLPWAFAGQTLLAETIWSFAVLLFSLSTLLFAARLLLFPDTVGPMLRHPVQSMFLGAIPMGLAVLINGFLAFAAPRMGEGAYSLATALWWLDVALAIGVAVLVPYLMVTRQQHALESLTAVWLLPVVAPEVAAGVAGSLAPHLDPAAAREVLVVGYLLWGISLSLAFALISLVLLRLVVHNLPDSSFAATSWLPLGPLGTGSLALMKLGEAAPHAWAGSPLADAAPLAAHLGVIGGLLLWGAGLWWLVVATLCTARHARHGMHFNLGWWGFTFPLGVFTLASFELLHLTDVAFFATTGVLLACALLAIWLLVMRQTLVGAWHGELFEAPCLASLGVLQR
ncbi:TDT family transporter [Pseudomonas sp. LS44]|uniref:TDT family transporter n=1 Tax=Pseudomonas sp. LS44 TaxID=1357074 RepID=UPI00215A67D4|nr:TDT family transporter [Pseudomonas sp. LS44]UVE18147.1 TDT family transporter [Pseudomonas sp. LS44]